MPAIAEGCSAPWGFAAQGMNSDGGRGVATARLDREFQDAEKAPITFEECTSTYESLAQKLKNF
jgi:hypothetical protein